MLDLLCMKVFPIHYVEAASYRLPIISSEFKSGSKEILLNGRGGTFYLKRTIRVLSKLLDDFYLNRKISKKRNYLFKKFKTFF